MRQRTSLLSLFFAVIAFATPHFVYAAIPFFGPIIPNAYNTCPASWGMLITVINNIISLLITLAIVFVAPIMIAYSGFLLVVNQANPGGINQAKTILTNTIVGIVIALAAWLIVDAIMAALYDQAAVGQTWSSLITSGGINPCISLPGSLNQVSGQPVSGISASGAYPTLPTTGACVASNLMQATAGSAYALTQSQANVLSCIAVAESSCGTNTTGARQPNGTPTTAGGMFQIVMGWNDPCHNLNIPSCTAAAQNAGFNVSGNPQLLNCSTAFSGGRMIPAMHSLAAACQAATANLNCNAQAAGCLVQANGGYSAWASPADQNCIAAYGP